MAVSSTTGGLRTGVCLSTDRPQNPYNGQVIYETDTNRTLVWDNSAWVVVADPALVSFSGSAASVTGNLTGNVTGNVTGDVTGDLTGDVAASAVTIGGENVTPYTGRKNFLINGSMLIAQRTTSASQGAGTPGYRSLDRWYCSYQDALTTTFSQNTVNSEGIAKSFKVSVDQSGSYANSMRFQQALETVNVIPLQGKTIVISAYIKTLTAAATIHEFGIQWHTSTVDFNGFSGWTGQNLTDVTSQCISGTWVRVSRTLTVPANAVSLAFTFGCQSGSGNSTDVCEISNVQLEIGDKATPFEHRSYGEELALCQRYYEKSYDMGKNPSPTNDPNGSINVWPYTTTANRVHIYAPFSVRKRATPTVTMYDTATGTAGYFMEDSFGLRAGQVIFIGETGFTMRNSVVLAGTGYILAHFIASAEL